MSGPPPHPAQHAYPPPMNYPVGAVPPPGQPGFGPPPPGQPGFGPPPPGQPGFGPPPPGTIPPGPGGPAGPIPPYGVPPPPYNPTPPGYPQGGAYPYPPGAPPAGYPGGYPGGPGPYPYPHGSGPKQSTGEDSDDSQPGDSGLRSIGASKRIKCTFVNHADTKIVLYTIDERGKLSKVCKLKDGKKEVIETFEGSVFLARGKRRKKRHHTYIINNNVLYAVTAEKDGESHVKAEIIRGPESLKELGSEEDKVAVKVKFINRSKRTVQLIWLNHKGKREKKNVLPPGRCWKTSSYESHCWMAHDVKNEDDQIFLNYGFYYSPWKTRKAKERVIITDHKPWKDPSSSSSSSD